MLGNQTGVGFAFFSVSVGVVAVWGTSSASVGFRSGAGLFHPARVVLRPRKALRWRLTRRLGRGFLEGFAVGIMSVQDKTGDTKIAWDPHDSDSVASARRTFDDLIAAGYAAFRVRVGEHRGECVKAFDAEAARVLMVPPLAGG